MRVHAVAAIRAGCDALLRQKHLPLGKSPNPMQQAAGFPSGGLRPKMRSTIPTFDVEESA